MNKKRTAILISGRGSNMAALAAACAERDFPAEIAAVVANRPDAAGLQRAEALGLAARVVDPADFAGPAEADAALDAALSDLGVELVCLAGYMRLLTADFVRRWAGRMINVHPSILPLFKGLDTHRKAIEAGMTVHGCSVHFVTPEMDSGPIIAQAVVPVLPSDDADALAARVLGAEHKLYPLALRLVAEGRARMHDGRTHFSGVAAADTMLLSPASGEEVVDIETLARMTP